MAVLLRWPLELEVMARSSKEEKGGRREILFTPPRSSLYTPLKITTNENTNLPLNLLNTPHLRLFLPHFFLSSAHPFLRPKCVRIVRIGENGVEK